MASIQWSSSRQAPTVRCTHERRIKTIAVDGVKALRRAIWFLQAGFSKILSMLRIVVNARL